MNRKTAIVSFLAVCIALAVLLLTQIVTPVIGSAIFAIALVLFGGLSRGFRANNNASKLGQKEQK